jgi:AraC-like DNA-binding protein
MDTSKISKDVFVELFGSAPGAPSDIFPAGAETMLPLRSFVSTLERKREEAGDARHAWCMGERLDRHSLGMLGRAVEHCATYGDALRTFIQGFPLLQSNTEVGLYIDEDDVRFSYRILDSRIWPRRADAELTLGLVLGLAKLYGVPGDAIRSICFEHGTDRDPRDLARHVGAVPRFEQEVNSVTLPCRVLSARRVAPHPELEDRIVIAKSLDIALIEQRRCTPVSHRVREQILKMIGNEPLAQARIARILGMSGRSLRRALAAEGTSFQEILDECRRVQGFALLVRSRMPLNEIAFQLGYSDQTAFTRALSRWFGVPPSDLRKSGAEEESVIR